MKFFTILFFIAFAVVLVNGQRGSGRRGPGGLVGRLLGGPRRLGARPLIGAGALLGRPQGPRPCQPSSSSVAPESSSAASEVSSVAPEESSVAPESSSVAPESSSVAPESSSVAA
ncbi:uncharacterized protein LOC105233139 isoform X1 [Bactrocera dorsalis]|uniref:Uncharacterized protein LOC105233139 isoform X1 n=1 Tax=Bactrocera dorsalis TaxID=27457 RepID=A0A6I9VPB2_BACDO|nr:uncharacterized protein LOC105233139 isoform X1 [Bactrocera dorsalis]